MSLTQDYGSFLRHVQTLMADSLPTALLAAATPVIFANVLQIWLS